MSTVCLSVPAVLITPICRKYKGCFVVLGGRLTVLLPTYEMATMLDCTVRCRCYKYYLSINCDCQVSANVFPTKFTARLVY